MSNFQRREWKSEHQIQQALPQSAAGLFLKFLPATCVYFVIKLARATENQV